MSDTSSAADRLGFYLFAGLVILAPLPFGATEPVAAGMLGLAVGVCLLLACLAPPPPSKAPVLVRTTLLVLALVILWAGVQATLGWWTGADNDDATAIARLLAASTEQIPALRLPILFAAGYVVLPLASFLCALLLIRDDSRYLTFLHVVLGANFAVVFACLIQFAIAPDQLLWSSKQHYLQSFTGTFINPNTAATHFGVLLLLALGLSLRQLQKVDLGRFFDGHSRNPLALNQVRLLGFYALAAFAFLVALLLTRSRAGILASLAGAAWLVASLTYIESRRRSSVPRSLAMSALSLVATFVVVIFFGERFLLRLDQGLIEPGRSCTYRSTWTAIKESNWWGTGLGSFQDIFQRYRSPECGLVGHWETGHSVFLEGWLTFGVPFLFCLAIAYYALISIFIRGMRERRRYRFIQTTSLGILIVLTLHSLVDFSLQVLGFSVAAASILGAGAAVSLRSRGHS